MIPFALVALLRARGTAAATQVAAIIASATIVSIIAIAVLPLIWLTVGLVIAAVWVSAPTRPSRGFDQTAPQ
jgi:hypothetical protein